MANIPAGFFHQLQQLYEKDPNLKAEWEREEPGLRAVLTSINDDIAFNYSLVEPIGVGGSGVVATVDDERLKARRAIKFPRPSPGKEDVLTEALGSEIEKLHRLHHPNLVRIYWFGRVGHQEREYPYFIMEFIEDAVPLTDYFVKIPPFSDEEIVAGHLEPTLLPILHQMTSAIAYMHAEDWMHSDIKPDNVLVTRDGRAVLIDLAFSKDCSQREGSTLVAGTDGFILPDVLQYVNSAPTDPNRLRGHVDRSQLSEWKEPWDLYSVGQTFLKLLDQLFQADSRGLTTYTWRYLRLMAFRMLGKRAPANASDSGFHQSTFGELSYSTIADAKRDLEKLLGIYSLEAAIPELNLYIPDTIQVTTLATTPFTKRVSDLVGHPAFKRLGGCSQLGLLNLLYPGATHTRLEHSIGTFSVVSRFILALYYDHSNPLFRQLMDESDLRAGLAAALLHDIGQYPLAHDLEEAESDVFSHENVGFEILRDESLRRLLKAPEGWNLDPDRVVAILRADPENAQHGLKDRILHSLVNGPLDADKIDYLLRDSSRLGLPYGRIIDFERLLRSLTIVFSTRANRTYASVGIHEKGKVPAEAIAFARYCLYGQVYWHHTYRAIKAVIHRVVWETLERRSKGKPLPKNKVRQELKDRFIHSTLNGGTNQVAWGPEDPHLDSFQIHYGDWLMLRWLSSQGGDVGEELVSLLKMRQLFRRVLVLSPDKAEDHRTYDVTHSFYQKADWRLKLHLQKELQRLVGEELPRLANLPTTRAVTPQTRDALVAAIDQGRPIVLVDLPAAEKASQMRIQYIVEEDARRSRTGDVEVRSLPEQSVVAHALQESFNRSLGKLRVFVHPDFWEFVVKVFDRQLIEELLQEAVKNVMEAAERGRLSRS